MHSMPRWAMLSPRRMLLCAWLAAIVALLVPPMIARPAPGSFISEIVPVGSGNSILFHADQGTTGAELWLSDGTAQGTKLVQDIAPGPGSSYPTSIVPAGSRLFFIADDGEHGRELWSGSFMDLGFYNLRSYLPLVLR